MKKIHRERSRSKEIEKLKPQKENLSSLIYKYFVIKTKKGIVELSKTLINSVHIDLNKFLSKIDILKNTDNYKSIGPYIYYAIKRELKCIVSEFLYENDAYHAGIFECTKKLIIHYGEEDENKNKKPLNIESLNKKHFKKYEVIKYFYSKETPERFINLIDKKDWTSIRFSILDHNCIHCVNEYLILNNITPIPFGYGNFIAYKYICDKCLKDLGRYKMYIKSNDLFRHPQVDFDQADPFEFKFKCKKCLRNWAEWIYNYNWLEKSEEEGKYYIYETNWMKKFEEEIKKYEELGEPLCDTLIKVKIKILPKYQYAIVRKNLIDDSGKNFGFVALVSLNENKIIEYGNEKYNNGSPVLRDINLEDKYLYHTVRTFQIDKNINDVFYSINLTPWTSNRYDVLYYSSYNFINVYLNKYNQQLILRKNSEINNSAYKHLCRDCYKKLNIPDVYINSNVSHVLTHPNNKNNKEDKNWCWNCGKKNATFHFVGRSFNIKYNYLCDRCYYHLAEPKNYMKINNFCVIVGMLNICQRCFQPNASYKLVK